MNLARSRPFVGAVAVSLLAAGVLAGCGSSGSDASSTTATTNSQGQGMDNAQMEEIQQCLSAAGIDMPTPPDQPSGQPSDQPTDQPTDQAQGTPPSGAADGPGDLFSDSEVVAALEACGITVPTGGPQGGAAPTASSTTT